MAKSHYSADSAPLPKPSLPSDGGKNLDVTAWFARKPVAASEVFLLTDTGPYVGHTRDLYRRLPEHDAVRRNSVGTGNFTPTSIA